jgi:O-antigen ligase
MNREKADLWCERGILMVVLAILVIGPIATGAAHVYDFLALQILTAMAMILWAVRIWVAPKSRILLPSMSWAVVAFVLLAIVRYLQCDIELVGRLELIRILVYAFLFFVIVNNLHNQEQIQIVSLVLICLGAVISCYALFQFFTGSNQVWFFVSPYKTRASGTYISPNHLGGFLEMILPLALAFTMAGRMKAWVRILLGYAGVVMLAGIAVTVSRGAWLATIVGLVVFVALLLSQKQYRLPAVIVLGVLGVAAILMLPRAMFIRMRIEKMLADNELQENTRFAIWEPAVRMWQDYPIWGAGPGHFDSLFRSYRPQGVQMQPDWVHNDYLNTLTDWGVVGTAIVLAAWILLAVGVAKTWRAVRPQPSDLGPVTGSTRFAFAVGAIVALSAILTHSWVDFNMHIPANAILCVSLMALLSSQIRFTTRQHWYLMGGTTKSVVTILLAAGVVYLCYQGIRRASEERWLKRAHSQELFSDKQITALKRAFEIEPKNSATAYRIGEAYRNHSIQSGPDYEEKAREAMRWYERCMELNRWNGYGFLRYGMCLDWIGQPVDSGKYFQRANDLDPSGYYTVAHVGIHYVHLRDYPAGIQWFERSLRLKRNGNPIAASYLDICRSRLLESATNNGPSFLWP